MIRYVVRWTISILIAGVFLNLLREFGGDDWVFTALVVLFASDFSRSVFKNDQD